MKIGDEVEVRFTEWEAARYDVSNITGTFEGWELSPFGYRKGRVRTPGGTLTIWGPDRIFPIENLRKLT